MGSPNSQRARINIVGKIDKLAKDLRAKLKELKSPNNQHEKRQKTLKENVGTIVFELCDNIVEGINGKAISADPLGLITGKSVFGEVVDVHCQAWIASRDEAGKTKLAEAQKMSVLSGQTGGMWTSLKMKFVDGAHWIYDKAKSLMTVIWNGIKKSFLWVWDKTKQLWAWIKEKVLGVWNWFINLFKSKGDKAEVKKLEAAKAASIAALPEDDIPEVSFAEVTLVNTDEEVPPPALATVSPGAKTEPMLKAA